MKAAHMKVPNIAFALAMTDTPRMSIHIFHIQVLQSYSSDDAEIKASHKVAPWLRQRTGRQFACDSAIQQVKERQT